MKRKRNDATLLNKFLYCSKALYTVFRKNTHSHFLSYIHELFVDFNKNCSEYTQGLTDSDNVNLDIHCNRRRNYDVTFVWLKLE